MKNAFLAGYSLSDEKVKELEKRLLAANERIAELDSVLRKIANDKSSSTGSWWGCYLHLKIIAQQSIKEE